MSTGLLMLCLVGCGDPRVSEPALTVESVLGGQSDSGFARADSPRVFSFPADHRAHPAFRNEWWYITGNLAARDGAAYGYQVTLFRNGLRAGEPESTSDFATHAVWMAHVAVTDVSAQRHFHASRFARGAGGLAGQTDAPFTVFVGNWTIESLDGTPNFPWRLAFDSADFALDLTVAPQKAMALNGDMGLSHKGGEQGNASYYYSATRLRTEGQVSLAGEAVAVEGLSWLDREWSTSALADNTVGWDWFSLQLDSGVDLMLYQLREADGRAHPASSGTITHSDGRTEHLTSLAFSLEPTRWWRSEDGRDYPVAWRVRVPGIQFDALVEARVDAQWMNTAVVYWEGSVAVTSPAGDDLGLGYLEMTGY
ncbi:MAG: lipocalin-like domain-containing protein [Pseudomonadota bacterium]